MSVSAVPHFFDPPLFCHHLAVIETVEELVVQEAKEKLQKQLERQMKRMERMVERQIDTVEELAELAELQFKNVEAVEVMEELAAVQIEKQKEQHAEMERFLSNMMAELQVVAAFNGDTIGWNGTCELSEAVV